MTYETTQTLAGRVQVDAQPDLGAEVAELRQRLHRTAAIEQAKGILMCHYGINEDAAFAVLHRWSSYANVKISRLSESLADAVVTGPQEPGAPSRGVAQLIRELETGAGSPL